MSNFLPCRTFFPYWYSKNNLKEKNYKYQDNTRLFTKDIIDGRDELGLTFFLGNGDIFWIGSLLDIDEARDIYENKFDDKKLQIFKK